MCLHRPLVLKPAHVQSTVFRTVSTVIVYVRSMLLVLGTRHFIIIVSKKRGSRERRKEAGGDGMQELVA